jgi:diketogulonate reductase-like aldo/keto reductase
MKNDILITAYSPLEQGHLPVNKTLQAVAEAHSVPPHQISLAWLVAQPHIITIPASSDPRHQKENISSADIVLTAEEMQVLDRLH